MLSLALVAAMTLTVQPTGEVIRGPYGVAHVFADTFEGGFYWSGFAAAEDRLWQMELSRRSAQGRLAEIVGRSAINSDRDAIRFGYTSEEYASMFNALSPDAQQAIRSYVGGINGFIEKNKSLPGELQGPQVANWTEQDVLAIWVQLIRQFGRGGAGEIRNLLLYTYLKDRAKDEAIEIIEDFAWQNDRDAICTVSDEDDPHKGVSPFPEQEPGALERHLGMLPRVNMLELLPAIRLSDQADMKELSAQMGLPHKWGSYAMAASAHKSAIGVPILLSAPQMGFSSPSIARQTSIDCPGYSVAGLSVPGLPFVLVGHNRDLAWGLTSGVADTDDIVFVQLKEGDASKYVVEGVEHSFTVVDVPIVVRGEESTTGRREMTIYGPVILKSVGTGVAYVRKSSLWLKEVASIEGSLAIARARSIADVRAGVSKVTANMNVFVAHNKDGIAYFYTGSIPIRSSKIDPRFPIPAGKEFDWVGMVAPEKMPYCINPARGWFANWNNKPVSWWPNFDTPAWGAIFRNENLTTLMSEAPMLSTQHFERFARTIATSDITSLRLAPYITEIQPNGSKELVKTAHAYLSHWDGERLDGSVARTLYNEWFSALQEELFMWKTGNFLSIDNFRQVVQPSVVYRALKKQTNIDYTNGRPIDEIAMTAFEKAVDRMKNSRGSDPALWRYRAGRISLANAPEILYNDRGTYIQVVELWSFPRGRWIAPPGVSGHQSSPHATDQAQLAANWALFAMILRREDLPNPAGR
ncbi:MAG: penicillin acylase family protein [Fimbriimonadales bacterium]|nr:penicillin acylase family protein [Fimbriimonadales bacterium]